MELQFYNRGRGLAAASPYHLYISPHPALRHAVAHYTLCLETALPWGGSGLLTLIPDAAGCLVYTLKGDGLYGRMYGPSSTAVTVKNDLGRCPFRFFIEFRPGGLYTFTSIPQWELRNRIHPLQDCAQPLDQMIQNCWRRSRDLDEFVAAVDQGLCAWLPGQDRMSALIWQVVNQPGRQAAALVEETGYSARHVARLLRDGVGMGYKSFCKILRVNAAVKLLKSGQAPVAHLAQDLGYFDQPHFIHDFKSICGVSPTAYQKGLSDFYNEPFKF